MSLFRELAKQVHPDVNNGGANYNNMMREVLANRNNEDALRNLARRWGLNIDGTFDEATFARKSAEERAERVFEAVVGSIISHRFRCNKHLRNLKGVITDIRTIKKGKIKGAKEYTVYNFSDAKVWKFKGYKPPFEIVGMANPDDLRIGKERVMELKKHKKTINEIRQNTADNMFRYANIRQNANYRGSNKQVYINGVGWRELIKTSKKSVYYRDLWSDDKVRYCNIKRVGYELRDRIW